MGKQVTVGGNRLGSGGQIKTELHNYGRSTHNLSRNFISSIAPGVLVPFYCNLALNGDTFDINLASMCRTIPTQAPLFGSFKLQLDMFMCPIRLYQGLLHNNKLGIGMQMSDVKLPLLLLNDTTDQDGTLGRAGEMNNTSLLKYLGLSGIGVPKNGSYTEIIRTIQAVPALCYYDIFKNYYANRQETKAFCITPKVQRVLNIQKIEIYNVTTWTDVTNYPAGRTLINDDYLGRWYKYRLTGKWIGLNEDTFTIKIGDTIENTLANLYAQGIINYNFIKRENDVVEFEVYYDREELKGSTPYIIDFAYNINAYTSDIKLQEFDLDNIDTMREDIFKESELGTAFEISATEHNYLPYSALTTLSTAGVANNRFAMNGLCVKTYQSDLFNAWVQTDWIDGTNGIAAVTAVSTAGDKLNLDALNLAQKVYNMLNRIAVSGGTYQDWQEAVWTQNAIRHVETPIYLGGMSSEVVFEEVVSTASSDANGDSQALGTLAGKGKLLGNKGGHLKFKVNEPCFILGIVSLTPRVCYSQGNDWYLTEIANMNDLHKPALDGIGFQDLMTEQAAWWDAKLTDDLGSEPERTAIGKVPAWINYMTDYDRAYGDFANTGEEGKAFMVLGRNYRRNEYDHDKVSDLTTYIDPTKFNYAFAYTELAAQNFWLQIAMDIKARRIMSAKIIPTL